MPKGSVGGLPRPLATAELVIEMYYMMSDDISINEKRLERDIQRIDIFAKGGQTDALIDVEKKTGDFSNPPTTDTKVEVIASAPVGRIQSLTDFGERGRAVVSISQDTVDKIKSKVNLEVIENESNTRETPPEEVLFTVR